jgi:hypothetical protein
MSLALFAHTHCSAVQNKLNNNIWNRLMMNVVIFVLAFKTSNNGMFYVFPNVVCRVVQ